MITLANMKAKRLIWGILVLGLLQAVTAAIPTTDSSPTNNVPLVVNNAPAVQPATPSTITTTPPNTAPTTVTHLWNLQGADIQQVITEISRETGKNFVVDPEVQGKVTIISSHPMDSEEAYQVFLSSLRVLGFSVVPDGNDLKIVPSRDAANQSVLVGDKNPGLGDQAVIRVINVHYVSAMQLIPALRPLLPTWGNIAAYAPSNSIIISGSADNVQRIEDIVNAVDSPETNGIDVMRLTHAVATDLVDELNKLILAARANGAGTNATLSADSQSNSILISGDAVSRLHLKVLIAKMDSEDASSNNNTQIVYLKYIQVKDILPILKGMVHQSVSYSMSSSGSSAYSTTSSSSTTGGSNDLSQASPQFVAAANDQLTNASINSGGSTDDKNPITIVGDVTNNALVITADPATMLNLRNVINALDVPPQQVLVQGIIAEVDAETASQLGIEWGTGGAGQTATSLGITGVTTPAYAFSGGGLGVGFLKSGDMRALIALLSSDTNSNIVSTPSITVLNNSPADIEVGENIFNVTGQYQPSSQGPAQQPYNTYTQNQIGLTLKVIPQITGDRSVRLVIDQENSALINDAQTSSDNPNQPTTEEKITTQVMVNDGQVVVLGGLISSQDDQVLNKVPVLGSVPVLGYLFQKHSTQKVKKDLMIFLRPVIIKGQNQAAQIAQSKYDFMRDVAILNTHEHGNAIASSTLPSRHPVQLPSPFDQR